MKGFIALALVSACLEMCSTNHEGQLVADGGVLTEGSLNEEKLPHLFLKRFYDGLSYDGFVGLMGRRMAGTKEIPVAQKRDLDDFFVGLMGRRNMELDESTGINEDEPGRKGHRTATNCKPRTCGAI
ncbi:tachykinin-3-like [Leucoraja erinacea]|uniref:tachykinin-3-like n=1 Tax=Leucoraja erinaceus TaxID=7782 RepID=UPI002453C249|nr:tachykinin-3-like [Leucoraja erinacea]